MIDSIIPVLATVAGNEAAADGTQQFLAGGLVVIATLVVVWLLRELSGRFFKGAGAAAADRKPEAQAVVAPAAAAPAQAPKAAEPKPAVAPSAPAVAAAPAAALAPGAIPLAVIAAAVAAVIDGPCRVLEVKPVSPGWALEGRRLQLLSHRLPR